MIEKKIKLMSSGQILSFCKACQKLESDVDVTDMSNRNYQIDGKSLLGLMSVKLGLPMRVVISGSDEELAEQYLGKYEFELLFDIFECLVHRHFFYFPVLQ